MENLNMILYAQDLEGLKNFYRQVFGFALSEAFYSLRASSYVRLQRGETELLLMETKDSVMDDSRNKRVASELTCCRPVFLIEEPMGDCREKTITCGGSFDPDHKEWKDLGYQICEGADMEGNIFEVRRVLQ
ncbi:MAG: hypothetical protein PHU67_05905 [Sulfurovum sp.]|nr:hypothetical protein [Sulfurovum sp.]MDD3499707.1 hypothetical protein [Sulfurovum sp.]